MGSITTFEDIQAWQESRVLVSNIYDVTNSEKFKIDFDLKSQIRRASISTMSNIAEGFERQSNKEFIYFLNISKASVGEVRSQLYIALDQEYITNIEFNALQNQTNSIAKQIGGFIKYLKNNEPKI